MAIIKAVSSKASIERAIKYVTKEEKTEQKLLSGLNCEPDTALDEMMATKELWHKTGGRTYKHYALSYHKDEKISLEQVLQNAIDLAKGTKAWNGFEVLIAVHKDKVHLHAHFIVNSVSCEDGHKLQWRKRDLQDLKDRCNEQSLSQSLSVPVKGKTFEGKDREETSAYTKETYQLLKKAEKREAKSYVWDIANAILEERVRSTSRDDFIRRMEERGYGVDWQDSHKYITYTDLARQKQGEKQCKIRNNKLEKYFNVDFGKEGMEHGFEVNRERDRERERKRDRESREREQFDREREQREQLEANFRQFESAQSAAAETKRDERSTASRETKERTADRREQAINRSQSKERPRTPRL